jgi:hypothetical protein
MGVKKQMDTFFASLGEQTGYRGRLVNTPMGPFRWNDAIELWENVNNGMVMNNISFMDEFAMMDYSATDGGADNVIPVYLNLDFTTGVLDPRFTFTRTTPGMIIGSDGYLRYPEMNIFRYSIGVLNGTCGAWASSPSGSFTLIEDRNGVPNNATRITLEQAATGNQQFNFAPNMPLSSSITFVGWFRGNTANIGNSFGNTLSMGFPAQTNSDNPDNAVWGTIGGTASIIGGYTNGVFLGIQSGTKNLFQLGNLSPTAWTQIKLTANEPVQNFTLYPGTAASTGVTQTYIFDTCEFKLQSGRNYTGHVVTTGSAYYAPRFTCGSTGGATLGLLLESRARNLLPNTFNFNRAASWTLANASATYANDAILTPEGYTFGNYKLTDNSTSGTHRLTSALVGKTAGTTGYYCASVWLKAGSLTGAHFTMSDATETNVITVRYNLQNGSATLITGSSGYVGVTSAIGTQAYNNGWYRAYLTAIAPPDASMRVHIRTVDSANQVSYSGTGTGFIYVWGPQLELGVYPSSYMPTGGNTGEAFSSRSVDTAVLLNAAELQNNWNRNQFTFVTEYTPTNYPVLDAFTSIASIHQGSGFTVGGAMAPNLATSGNGGSTVAPVLRLFGNVYKSNSTTVYAPYSVYGNPILWPNIKQSWSSTGNIGGTAYGYNAINGITGSSSIATAVSYVSEPMSTVRLFYTSLTNENNFTGVILKNFKHFPTSENSEQVRQRTT